MSRAAKLALLPLSLAIVAGCAESSKLPMMADVGTKPTLVAPNERLVPTVHIAPARGWPAGQHPIGAPGTQVVAFADGLMHPRWLLVLPNGDVLVAESDAPDKPDDAQGIKGWVMKLMMKRAGSDTPSANRITLLRDLDGDGQAEVRSIFLEGLNSPFGMIVLGDYLYVANTDAVVRFPYLSGATRISEAGTKVLDLPAGTINHHWTKNLIASPDGKHLYITVGSNSNVAERGMENEQGRAAIWQLDLASGSSRAYATGLRNPNGLAWEPESGQLWAVVNERDELGSDLVPDYLTSVQKDSFYGWPYSFYGANVDARVRPARPDLVAKAVVPDYALGSHVAPLGLTWGADSTLPMAFHGGMFVGQHGSWNRRPYNGYNVVFVPFTGGRPSGPPIELLQGFLSPQGEAWGRPVGLALDKRGALLVADDVGNAIWRVSGTTARK